jgi:aryl-alcohol dehydrogenase-like predicted oxidoreductase
MNSRPLGKTGIDVAPLGFGGNVFGWTIDESRSFELLDEFAAGGFNLIDSADYYSRFIPGHAGGESETILGKWLKRSGRRDKMVIATKVGKEMGPGWKGLTGANIERAIDASLRRLQTDYIDLYQSHDDDTATPLEETLSAYDRLVRRGKVRAVGASNYSASRLSEALSAGRKANLTGYQTLQPGYNLCNRRDYESTLEDLCVRNEIAVLPFAALADGFLTGKYHAPVDPKTNPRAGRINRYFDERGRGILRALDKVARDYSATPAQVAIAWLLSRPSVTAPIASATSVGQLAELMKAAALQLDAASLESLTLASAA